MDDIHKNLLLVIVIAIAILTTGILIGKSISKPLVPEIVSKNETPDTEKGSEKIAADSKAATEIKETSNT